MGHPVINNLIRINIVVPMKNPIPYSSISSNRSSPSTLYSSASYVKNTKKPIIGSTALTIDESAVMKPDITWDILHNMLFILLPDCVFCYKNINLRDYVVYEVLGCVV